MTQVWNDLLFLHYSVAPNLLRPHVPKEPELDTYEGEGWISIIPLEITDSRLLHYARMKRFLFYPLKRVVQ